MTVKDDVLNYLLNNKNQTISGTALATKLSVSRNAIWKAIEEIRASGYSIESIPRKGYRLIRETKSVDDHQIRHSLNKAWANLDITIENQVTSTNNLAKNQLSHSPDRPVLIIATEQTVGRGRRGRSFYSRLDEGLYFTLGFRPQGIDINEIHLYTLVAASAMSLTLETYLDDPIKIKWVNDLFYQGRKTVGILSEVTTDLESSGIYNVVIGMGLNLAGDFSQADNAVQDVAGTLFGDQVPTDFNVNDLIARFLNHFDKFNQQFENRSFLDPYRERLLGLNQQVSYQEANKTHFGIIRGIDPHGKLIVEAPNGSHKHLVSKEIHFSSQQFLTKE